MTCKEDPEGRYTPQGELTVERLREMFMYLGGAELGGPTRLIVCRDWQEAQAVLAAALKGISPSPAARDELQYDYVEGVAVALCDPRSPSPPAEGEGLVERLRKPHENRDNAYAWSEAIETYERERNEAATALSNQQKTIKRLREALKASFEFLDGLSPEGFDLQAQRRLEKACALAFAALKATP